MYYHQNCSLELRELTETDEQDVYDLLQEIPAEENGLINKAHGLTFEEFQAWLVKKRQEARQQGIVDGWKAPSTTYWLYADGTPVGFGSVRHFLTDALRRAGGHIGYGIAPRYRGKGYGNEIPRLLLIKARELGIEKALVTVRLDNMASQAVALANGGVVTEKTDERVLIWIDTKDKEQNPVKPKSDYENIEKDMDKLIFSWTYREQKDLKFSDMLSASFSHVSQ